MMHLLTRPESMTWLGCKSNKDKGRLKSYCNDQSKILFIYQVQLITELKTPVLNFHSSSGGSQTWRVRSTHDVFPLYWDQTVFLSSLYFFFSDSSLVCWWNVPVTYQKLQCLTYALLSKSFNFVCLSMKLLTIKHTTSNSLSLSENLLY